MKYIVVSNWNKHQHYKDRRPTWIKLEIDIIEEFDADGIPKKFYHLPDQAKLTFTCLLCLRANYNNRIPFPSEEWLCQRLGLKSVSLKPLIDAGYIKVDTDSVSNPYQVDTECDGNGTPEREKERDIEKESASPTPLAIQLNEQCKKINALPRKKEKFNPWAWVTWAANHAYHPKAISHTLDQLANFWPDIGNPWTYATTIIAKESGNFYERAKCSDVAEEKREWEELVSKLRLVHGAEGG